MARKAASASKKDKSGPPAPRHLEVEAALDALAAELSLAGFGAVGDHNRTVEYFCTHKVTGRGNDVEGFYVLAALYVWREEAAGRFDPKENRHIIPENEIFLAHNIFLFFARRLNEEAGQHHEKMPFPHVLPARPDSDYLRVPFFYLQQREYAERVQGLYDAHKTPKLPDESFGDNCAHFILYRSRRSKPVDLMKSFLVIKPLVKNAQDDRVQHYPTFHVYQAPRNLGGSAWGTPGRVLPLKSGLFIVGGQHARELEPRTGRVNDAGAPFRALEMIFLPWGGFDSAPIAGGIIMSVNRDGDPLVGRICVRPTLIQNALDARIGSVPVAGLAEDIAADREAEEKAAALATNIDGSNFLDIYTRFDAGTGGEGERTLIGMAQRIAELSNNHSGENWSLVSGMLKDGGGAMRDADIQGFFEEAVAGVMDAQGEPFSIPRDLRIAPLTPLS